MLHGPINWVLSSYFDIMDEAMVLKAVSLTKDVGGPLQLDSEQYWHILSSCKFKQENKELKEQIAWLTRLLASEVVDPYTIKALVLCWLIPLNKNPGIRPICVGEVICRIIRKCIGWQLVLNQVLKQPYIPWKRYFMTNRQMQSYKLMQVTHLINWIKMLHYIIYKSFVHSFPPY